MPDGGTLTVASVIKKNNRIKILITDTGCGISKENLPHVFDPFFTTKESGAGLGLAISHGILQEHYAKIEVHSAVNHGTTFTISFNRSGK